MKRNGIPVLFGVGLSILSISTVGAAEMKTAPINTIFGQGDINPYGEFFVGQTYLQSLVARDDVLNSSIANVTFEPGARTNWHKHSGGQILLVLSGQGRYQTRNGEIQVLNPGDVVQILPDIEHWHGAAPDSWFTHVSIEPNIPNNQVQWLEPVSDEQYK